MAKRKSRKQSLRWLVMSLVVAAAGFFILISVQEKHGIDFGLPKDAIPTGGFITELFSDNFTAASHGADYELEKDFPEARLKVHFIDVGQGKAIFIEAPDKTALVDGGEKDAGAKVLRYIRSRGVTKLDILIGTHPHSDHVGGLDTIIRGLEIGTLVMPEIPDDLVPTALSYTDVLEAIAEKNLKIHKAVPGDSFELGDTATLTVMAPINEYLDLNDYSVVTRLEYGETSFLFTGDATSTSERDMTEAGVNLHSTVLDVGHHGSDTSSSSVFLSAVRPQLAVISCGLDNSYGHPRRVVMQRLLDGGVKILRTDLDGTAVVYSDGKILKYLTEK